MNRLIDALAMIENVAVSNDGNGMYLVSFVCGWVKDGFGLKGIWGTGNTVEEAAENYLLQIAGQRLIVETEQGRHELYVIERVIKEGNDDHQQETV